MILDSRLDYSGVLEYMKRIPELEEYVNEQHYKDNISDKDDIKDDPYLTIQHIIRSGKIEEVCEDIGIIIQDSTYLDNIYNCSILIDFLVKMTTDHILDHYDDLYVLWDEFLQDDDEYEYRQAIYITCGLDVNNDMLENILSYSDTFTIYLTYMLEDMYVRYHQISDSVDYIPNMFLQDIYIDSTTDDVELLRYISTKLPIVKKLPIYLNDKLDMNLYIKYLKTDIEMPITKIMRDMYSPVKELLSILRYILKLSKLGIDYYTSSEWDIFISKINNMSYTNKARKDIADMIAVVRSENVL